MRYHLRLVQGLPERLVLPTAGLLGQSAQGGPCPSAKSLLHPKVSPRPVVRSYNSSWLMISLPEALILSSAGCSHATAAECWPNL